MNIKKRHGMHCLDALLMKVILLAAALRGIVRNEGGILFLHKQKISWYFRGELKKYLLQAMGRNWWEQEDAIRAAASYLGFQRVSPISHKALQSAINGALRQHRLERDKTRIRVCRTNGDGE